MMVEEMFVLLKVLLVIQDTKMTEEETNAFQKVLLVMRVIKMMEGEIKIVLL